MNNDHLPWWKDAIYRDGVIAFVVLGGGLILLLKAVF